MVQTVLRVLVLLAPVAQAANSGVVSGRVVDGASGRPVTAAIVTLGGANVARVPAANPETLKPGSPRILTGGDGRFVFRGLPIANFSVTAERSGYAAGANGRRRPGGASHDVVLTSAQPSADVIIPIWKNGSIGGMLSDEAGEPVVRAQLLILKGATVAGARKFVPGGTPAQTDDRGIYRFGNLMPGDYLVAVSSPLMSRPVGPSDPRTFRGATLMPPSAGGLQIGDVLDSLGRGSIVPPPTTNGRVMVYPTTFYPSALSPAEARVITLGVGEDKTAVDIQIQPVATARVSGTVMGPDGPVASVLLRLRANGFDDVVAQDAITTITDASGDFAFPAVPWSQYTLRATQPIRSASGAPLYLTDTPISVSHDVDGVVAVVRPGFHVTGRVEYQGAAPPSPPFGGPTFRPVPFSLDASDGSGEPAIGAARSSAAGFTIDGVSPGRYLIRVGQSPTGWMFKSAVMNDVDVSITPFDLRRDVDDLVITFTDRWSGLGGTVHDAGGNPDVTATVLVFPTNADGWRGYGWSPRRLKSRATNANGEFAIGSVPPGDYFVVAIPEDQSDNWRDLKTLDALSRIATTITIAEGEHKTIDLRTTDVPR